MKKIVVSESHFANMTLGVLKARAKEHYRKNYLGKTVVNKDTGISVQFSMSGIRHLLNARNAGYVKYKAVWVLKEAVILATLTNFKKPDSKDDSTNVFGYCNFKVKITVEGSVQTFRIVVRITKDGQFYYDHSVRVKK